MSAVSENVMRMPTPGGTGLQQARPAQEGMGLQAPSVGKADAVVPRPAERLTLSVVAAPAPLARRAAFAVARTTAGAAIAIGALWGLALLVGAGAELDLSALCALAIAGAAAVSAAALHPRGAQLAPIGVAAVCLVAALVSGGALAEGLRALWTSFASTLADASAWRLPELALADPAARATSSAACCAALAFPTGALIAGLVGLRRPWWLLVLVPFPLFCTLTGGLSLPYGPAVLVIAGASAAIGAASPRGAAIPAVGAEGLARAACSIAMAAFALVGVGVLAMVVPPAAYSQPAPAAALRSSAAAVLHDARYGGRANALPAGNLAGLSAWRADDAVALSLRSEDGTIEPMYLRGFVGAQRDGKGWHALSEKDYHASDALFWWLHEDGFTPLSQLGAALDASLENGEAARQLSKSQTGLNASGNGALFVAVENRAASSEWLYVPYGMSELTGASAGEAAPACKDRADEACAPRGLLGARSYGFSCRADLSTAYPDIAALSWIARDEQAPYWRNESNYNAFAYERYARNTDADEAVVASVLGEAPATENAHIDYAAAATAVLTWLDQNVAYDESYGAPTDGGDVLADVLTGSKRGWSAHFATAAVAMLRHYGIPARYVEGYLVRPADVEGATATGAAAVQVPAANGHAWAEMYVDGTGWVPVEAVAAVRADMPQADWARGIQADGRQRAVVPPEQAQTDPDKPDTAAELLQQALVSLGWLLVALLVLFDLFALVFFLIVLIRRLLARRRRRIAFADPDDARAVRSMAAWMADIARFRFPRIAAGDVRALSSAVADAYGGHAAEEWADAQAVGRKAAFSEHGATPEERSRVAHAAANFADTVGRAEGAHRRWIMRYIERLM